MRSNHLLDSWEYGWDLAVALVMPHIKRRKAKGKLNKALLFTIDSLIVSLEDKESEDDNDMQEEEDAWPEAVEGPHPSQVSIRRCGPCVDKLKTKQHKIEKDTLSKKKKQCQLCCRALCKEHAVQLCISCSCMVFLVNRINIQLNLRMMLCK